MQQIEEILQEYEFRCKGLVFDLRSASDRVLLASLKPSLEKEEQDVVTEMLWYTW